VCTFAECNTPDQTYESRKSWFDHELQFHRRRWECSAGCSLTFQSQDALREHFRTAHSHLERSGRIEGLLEICPQVHVTEEASCALCQAKLPSLINLRRHLEKHQTELSLFALPSRVEDQEESEDNASIHNTQSGKESNTDEEDSSSNADEEWQEEGAVKNKSPDTLKPPVRFKDALGRTYSFPWETCKTWKVCTPNHTHVSTNRQRVRKSLSTRPSSTMTF
jgi:hypothetical protein